MGYFDSPKLWPALIYGFVGSVGWALVQTQPAGLWYVLGNALTLVGFGLAGITVFVYLQHHIGEFIDVLSSSMNKTKSSTLAEKMQGLTNEAVAVVRSQGEISLGLRMTARGPRMYIHSTLVPLDFVKFEFLPRRQIHDGITHTAPIGSWSEGKQWKTDGECRRLAREFTQHLVSNGLAVWGAGNQSATLVGDIHAFELMKMLGMVDRSVTMSDTSEEVGEAVDRK